MKRLTHERNSGMKTGYWSPDQKDELVKRLAAYENTGIESHQGMQVLDVLMVVKYGTYEAYCPADDCYMENVGFYVEDVGYPQMPLGPLENYAKVSGIFLKTGNYLIR